MKDYITAKERLSNPYKYKYASNVLCYLFSFAIIFYLLIEVTNAGVMI